MNRTLIADRLALLVQSLDELEPILAPGPAPFVAEPMRHHAGERLLEILVECARSINNEVGQVRTDYYSSFFHLVHAGWLDSGLARRLADLSKLRNTDVHHYRRLNLGKLHASLLSGLPHWRTYAAAVDKNTQP